MHSILAPEVAAERVGVVPYMVCPTGLAVRSDGRLDIYDGMADRCIGVTRVSGHPASAHSGAGCVTHVPAISLRPRTDVVEWRLSSAGV